MTARPASRREHQRFCAIENWTEVRNARGTTTGHHIAYELALPDGRVLRTRISRPANSERYGVGLWSHILRDQLDVTESEFWTCVDDRIPPTRSTIVEPPASALPAGLVHQLVHTLGLGASEIATLTLAEAISRLTDHWSRSDD